jgi:hypothetical protein
VRKGTEETFLRMLPREMTGWVVAEEEAFEGMLPREMAGRVERKGWTFLRMLPREMVGRIVRKGRRNASPRMAGPGHHEEKEWGTVIGNEGNLSILMAAPIPSTHVLNHWCTARTKATEGSTLPVSTTTDIRSFLPTRRAAIIFLSVNSRASYSTHLQSKSYCVYCFQHDCFSRWLERCSCQLLRCGWR